LRRGLFLFVSESDPIDVELLGGLNLPIRMDLLVGDSVRSLHLLVSERHGRAEVAQGAVSGKELLLVVEAVLAHVTVLLLGYSSHRRSLASACSRAVLLADLLRG